jgi:hypothetical protein
VHYWDTDIRHLDSLPLRRSQGGAARRRHEAAQAQGPARQLMKEQETKKCTLIRSPTWSQSDPKPSSRRGLDRGLGPGQESRRWSCLSLRACARRGATVLANPPAIPNGTPISPRRMAVPRLSKPCANGSAASISSRMSSGGPDYNQFRNPASSISA